MNSECYPPHCTFVDEDESLNAYILLESDIACHNMLKYVVPQSPAHILLRNTTIFDVEFYLYVTDLIHFKRNDGNIYNAEIHIVGVQISSGLHLWGIVSFDFSPVERIYSLRLRKWCLPRKDITIADCRCDDSVNALTDFDLFDRQNLIWDEIYIFIKFIEDSLNGTIDFNLGSLKFMYELIDTYNLCRGTLVSSRLITFIVHCFSKMNRIIELVKYNCRCGADWVDKLCKCNIITSYLDGF